jgi:predicted transposase YdaD
VLYAVAVPSQLHEALLQLFRNRPALAPELLRDALRIQLPEYSEARIDSADLTLVQPTEYRADLVVLLLHGEPVLGIVVEVQLSPDERKGYVWPVYVAGLRARLECPVCLLVVTADEATARWAAKTVELGGANRFTPFVLGPSGVPVVTDAAQALADPELAVLSAMAHGEDADVERSVQIALAAQMAAAGLDEERSRLYFDLVLHALSEAARRALQTMDPAKYEYQSDFARRYVAQGRQEGRQEGRAEGRTEGRADLLTRQLTLRFGPLPDAAHAQLASASIEQLDAMGERLLSASSLQEVLNL